MTETITLEPYGGVADVVFWPLILLLLVLAWRFRAHKKTAAWCALAALAILVLGSITVIVFGMTSLSVLHDFNVALVLLGGCLLVIAVSVTQEITIGKWQEDRALGLFAIGMGLVGLAMVIHGIVVPMQDLLLPRTIVEGDITLLEARARRAGNRPGYYIVHIGNTRVQASTPLYESLRLGEHVRAEVSRGSDFIRRLERNPAPAAK